MHVPDGFLDAPTSVATGVAAAAAVGLALRGCAARARRPGRTDGGARRDLRLRRADAELPGRRRHERPPPGRCPRRGAGRSLDSGPLPERGAARAEPALRRRGSDRPGHQRRADGRGRGRSSAGPCSGGCSRCSRARVGLVAPLAAVAAYVSVPVTALAFVGLYAVGGTAPIPLDTLTTAMLGWHAGHRAGRGRDHRARGRRASSRCARTSCTARGRSSPTGSSRSARPCTEAAAVRRVAHPGPARDRGPRRAAARRSGQLLRLRQPRRPRAGRRGPGVPRPGRGARGSGRAAGRLPGEGRGQRPRRRRCRRGRRCLRGPAGDRAAHLRRTPPTHPHLRTGADMGAGHGHRLHYHGHSAVHRAQPHLKLLALLGFVLVVVATPGDRYLALRRLPRRAGRRRGRLVRVPAAVPRSSGWSSRCRSSSSRCWCRSSRTARGPSCSGVSVSEPGLVAAGGAGR